jgi:hypothetical protein
VEEPTRADGIITERALAIRATRIATAKTAALRVTSMFSA